MSSLPETISSRKGGEAASTLCELALGRALAYLRGAGVELTPERLCEALRLVEAELAAGECDLLARVMDAVVRRFVVSPRLVPAPVPPPCRGSIGYG